MDFRDGWIAVEPEQFSEEVENWKKERLVELNEKNINNFYIL